MTLLWIIAATFAGGVLSVLLAASLALTVLRRYASVLVSFAVGAMLTTVWLDLIPEALALGLPPNAIGGWILLGLLAFFLLEKLALWRHDHSGHAHNHDSPSHAIAPMIVVGSGLHHFVDGVLIAAAFLANQHLGIATALAVILHEIPHEMGDFMVLLSTGMTRRRALLLNALSGAAMIAGGVLGYLALAQTRSALPPVLALAAASFMYIAIADLVPLMHRQRVARTGLWQTVLLGLGGGTVMLGIYWAHA